MSRSYELEYTITGSITVPEEDYDFEDAGCKTEEDRLALVEKVEADHGYEAIFKDAQNYGELQITITKINS